MVPIKYQLILTIRLFLFLLSIDKNERHKKFLLTYGYYFSLLLIRGIKGSYSTAYKAVYHLPFALLFIF